jgi:predicted N-acetyltransferase YhbS
MEIRTLHESDDRSRFQSGDPDLDRFFHDFAGQNQFKHYVGVSYVAVDEGHILGFATVAPGHLEIEELPTAARRKLPRYPLPVLRLARLAVDISAQGLGVGGQLLKFVLTLALRMAHEFGCVGVIVDAKPQAVDFYEKYGFIRVEAVDVLPDRVPSPTPMFLPMRAISATTAPLPNTR